MKKVPELRFKEFSGEWEERQIGEVLNIGNGKDYRDIPKGEIPVFGTGGYLTKISNFLYDGETVFIGRKGTINKPFYYKGKFWTVDTLFYTHNFKNTIPKFIYYLFLKINWLLYNEASGVPSLSKLTITKVKIFISLIQEQQKIVDFLSLIDNKISLTEEKLENLKNYKKGIMQKIFSQEIRFKDEKGEDYPEWETRRLEEISECMDNRRKPLNSAQRIKKCGKIPYYGANGIVDYIEDYIFDEDIVLLAEDGGNFDDFINKPIAQFVTGKSWINNHAHVLKGKDNIDIKFLFYSLVHKDIRNFINGTSRSKLNKSSLLNISIDVSTLKEQQKIANFLTLADKKISITENSLEKLKTYKKGLLQKMFI